MFLNVDIIIIIIIIFFFNYFNEICLCWSNNYKIIKKVKLLEMVVLRCFYFVVFLVVVFQFIFCFFLSPEIVFTCSFKLLPLHFDTHPTKRFVTKTT